MKIVDRYETVIVQGTVAEWRAVERSVNQKQAKRIGNSLMMMPKGVSESALRDISFGLEPGDSDAFLRAIGVVE